MANAAIIETLGEMLGELGGVPLDRIRLQPPPGTATVLDVIEIHSRERRLFELVDRVLIEKAMGYLESILALAIAGYLRAFVVPRNLGHVSGADGMIRLFGDLVRIPDVAFTAWERFPEGRLPTEPIPGLVPNLAVEIMSVNNTKQEMGRKRREYFQAGVRLVWIVDPRERTVAVYTSPTDVSEFDESHMLTGGDVLPEFSMSVATLFAELDRRPEKAAG